MTPEEIAAQLGAQIVYGLGDRWAAYCPTCGVATSTTPLPRPVLCLPCTEAEIGEYADELAARVSRKLAKSRYYALPRDETGKPILPSLSNRAWHKLIG